MAKNVGYDDEQLGRLPEGANLGLGCGNPIALATLRVGERVLDLGSGAGFDCFLAAEKVGKYGKVIGVDMTEEMIEKAVREGDEGMTFGLRAVDTIVERLDGEITTVLPREQIYHIQTPQSFTFQTLWDAHCKALEAGTRAASDDAGLVLKAGNRVKVIEGDPRNIKITGPVDFELVQRLIRDG